MTTAAAAVAMLTACGGDAARGDGVTRSDSAGVQIVTSPGEDRPLAWQFTRVGVLRDSAGEPWYFTRVHQRGAAVRADGEIYLLDATEPPVERFGPDGAYRGGLGRKGGGPGEFQFPTAVMLVGDTLYVRDFMKGGYVRFAPDGAPVADRRISESLGFVAELRYHRDGVWMTGSIQDSVNSVVGFFADTLRATALHRVSTPRGRALQFSCVGISGSTPMFSPNLLWAASGERAAVHAQPGYEIWVYRGATLEMSLRRNIAARAPTIDDAKVLYPDGWKVSFGGARADCVVPVEEVVAQQGLASVMPQVQDLLVLADGRVLVKRSLFGAAESIIDVFDADGAYAGTLRGTPMPLAMLPSGEWLIPEKDEDTGGIVVAIHRVERGS